MRCRLKHAFARKSLAVILAAVLAIPVPQAARASASYAVETAEANDDTQRPDSGSPETTPDEIMDAGSSPAETGPENKTTAETGPEKAQTDAAIQASSADIQAWTDALGPDGISVNGDTITLLEDRSISTALSVTETLVLDLNGYELSGTAASSADNMITVSGSLELSGEGSLRFSGGDNVISVTASGTLVDRGTDIHSISCNRGVFCAGTFMLYDGCISGNTSSANGAGIVVHGTGGRLDMSGGEVSGNKTSGSGGGIRIQSGAAADIHGSARITDNSADTAGGGIHVLNAACRIYGDAVVSENSSPLGGGIYVEGNSTLDLDGDCRIVDNRINQTDQTGSAVINTSGNAFVGNTETLQELIDKTPVDGTLILPRNFREQESVTVTKNITIDFDGHTIEGSGANTGQLFLIEGGQVTFRGNGVLTQKPVSNAYYVIVNVQGNSEFTVDGIEVSGQNQRGFLIEDSALHFASGSMHDCGAANTAGGAVVAIAGNITISGGRFYDNRSNQGAVIRALQQSQIRITAGTFENNQAGNGDHFTYGGAVYTEGGLQIGGAPKFVNNTAGFGGAVYVLGEAVIEGGEFSGNTAYQMGGAVHGQNLTLKGSANIHDNQACWGGGVVAGCIGPQGASTTYMNSPGNLYLSGNAQISGNKAVEYSSYRSQGGGVWAYDLEMEGHAQIDGNTCAYGGGGIYSRHDLRITAGHITDNTGDIGGGIFLFNKGFIQGTPNNKILIQGNQALDTASHQFAGGGIFVEHKVDSTQGTYGADLQINGVVITDNTARGGGGIGGCGEAIVQAHSGTGMALYGNASTGSGENARAQDLYLDGKGTLATQGIGRTDIDYAGLGRDTASGPWQEMEIKQAEKYLEGMRFTATMSEDHKRLANGIAGVVISGNTCNTHGGGIGGNGAINIGMPVQTITARKVWDDFQDKYGERPQSLEVTLKHKGSQFVGGKLTDVDEVIDTRPVSAADGWKYTWTDLPTLDDANQPWVYYVDEIEVPDYLKSISGTVITNSYIYRDFTVSKIWNDANDQDGIRPEEIEIQVLRNDVVWETVTLNASNQWKHVYSKVDRFDANGNEYRYSVREVSVPDGYTASTDGFTVTNTHTPVEYTDFEVRKIWDDANDQDGLRPEAVVAILYRDTEELDRVTLNAGNHWSHKFEHMPKTNGAGRTYVYTVKEETVADGYRSAVNGYEITNKHVLKGDTGTEKTSFTVQKRWDDNDNADNVRPEMIEIAVYRNGIWFDSVLLSANNNWSHTYLDVNAKDASGTPYVYSVKEVDVPEDYTSTVSGYTITNHYLDHREEPEKTRLLVVKIWDDENNKDGLRPGSIEVVLYQNDREFDRIVLSEANSWRKEYTGLEARDGSGAPYIYSVKELHVPEGYTSAVNGYVITNRHTPQGTTSDGEDDPPSQSPEDPDDPNSSGPSTPGEKTDPPSQPPNDPNGSGTSGPSTPGSKTPTAAGSQNSGSSGRQTSPQTGDGTQALPWFLLMLMSLMGILLLQKRPHRFK